MASVGDVVADLQTVSYEGRLEIRPPEGETWFIPNIYHSREAALYRVTDDGEVMFASDDDSAGGAWADFKWFVTRDSWLEVENANPDEQDSLIGYDGMRIG